MKYKSIPENKTSYGHKWRLNKWSKVEGGISLCNNGFHCSNNFISAMNYVTPGYLALVEVRGDKLEQSDKSVHQEMRVVRFAKWTKKDSISLAIFSAELVLDRYEDEYPYDMRPRQAIEAAWAAAEAAARTAAWAAARTAARAAWAAAEAAARAAARQDILNKCHEFIMERKFQ